MSSRKVQFKEYMASQDIEGWEGVVEQFLPEVIRSFDSTFQSLWEIEDINLIDSYRARIHNDPSLREQDEPLEDSSCSRILLLYRNFLTSLSDRIADPAPKSDSVPTNKPAISGVVNPETQTYVEGAIIEDYHAMKHERNRNLRNACVANFKKEHGGRIFCVCCGFDFKKAYGNLGEDFIEVHHKYPISQTTGEHEVVPNEKDLIPLCSNCHSMIHRRLGTDGKIMQVEELRDKYCKTKYN